MNNLPTALTPSQSICNDQHPKKAVFDPESYISKISAQFTPLSPRTTQPSDLNQPSQNPGILGRIQDIRLTNSLNLALQTVPTGFLIGFLSSLADESVDKFSTEGSQLMFNALISGFGTALATTGMSLVNSFLIHDQTDSLIDLNNQHTNQSLEMDDELMTMPQEKSSQPAAILIINPEAITASHPTELLQAIQIGTRNMPVS